MRECVGVQLVCGSIYQSTHAHILCTHAHKRNESGTMYAYAFIDVFNVCMCETERARESALPRARDRECVYRAGDREVGEVHDLAALPRHLHLLLGVQVVCV